MTRGRDVTDEDRALRDKLAEIMEPEAWAEYHKGNGVCSNNSGFKCVTSIEHANTVMRYLIDEGKL